MENKNEKVVVYLKALKKSLYSASMLLFCLFCLAACSHGSPQETELESSSAAPVETTDEKTTEPLVTLEEISRDLPAQEGSLSCSAVCAGKTLYYFENETIPDGEYNITGDYSPWVSRIYRLQPQETKPELLATISGTLLQIACLNENTLIFSVTGSGKLRGDSYYYTYGLTDGKWTCLADLSNTPVGKLFCLKNELYFSAYQKDKYTIYRRRNDGETTRVCDGYLRNIYEGKLYFSMRPETEVSAIHQADISSMETVTEPNPPLYRCTPDGKNKTKITDGSGTVSFQLGNMHISHTGGVTTVTDTKTGKETQVSSPDLKKILAWDADAVYLHTSEGIARLQYANGKMVYYQGTHWTGEGDKLGCIPFAGKLFISSPNPEFEYTFLAKRDDSQPNAQKKDRSWQWTSAKSLPPVPKASDPMAFSNLFPDPLLARYVATLFEKRFFDSTTKKELASYQGELSFFSTDSPTDLTGIGYLTGVTSISFSKNEIKALPPEIGNLTKLERIDLHKAYAMKTIPKEIGSLKKLKFLDLDLTSVETLPESLGGATALEYLSASCCGLKALPESIGQLQNLLTLDIHSNRISRVPESLGRLKKLRYLDLSYTDKIPSIPEGVGSMPDLQYLDLFGCDLKRLPEGLRYNKNLVYCNVWDNYRLDESYQHWWKDWVWKCEIDPFLMLEDQAAAYLQSRLGTDSKQGQLRYILQGSEYIGEKSYALVNALIGEPQSGESVYAVYYVECNGGRIYKKGDLKNPIVFSNSYE